MAIRTLDNDLNIISALPDEPTDVEGMSAGQVKAKFDEGGNLIKNYINETLISDIGGELARVEGEITAAVTAAELQSGNVPTAGAAGQVLRKNTNADYDFSWQTITGDSAPAANTLMQRDAGGRVQVADPSAPQDAATKGYVDSIAGIGSVKIQSQANTDPKYLPCDGAQFDPAQYPGLAAIYGHDITSSTAKLYSKYFPGGSSNYYYFRNASKTNLNGYDVMTGYEYYYDGVVSLYYPVIAYARTGVNETFTVLRITSALTSASNYCYACDVLWDGTRWAVLLYTSTDKGYLAYSSSLTSTSWTVFRINETTIQNNCFNAVNGSAQPSFLYKNGYYVIAWNQSSSSIYSCYISYCQTLTGAWTTTRLPGAQDSMSVFGLWYVNGYWVIAYSNGYISYSDSSAPIGFSSLAQTNYGSNIQINSIKYLDGKFCALSHNNATNCPCILYNTAMSASGWQKTGDFGITSETCRGFDYDGSYWVVKANNGNVADFHIAASLTGAFTTCSGNMLYINGTLGLTNGSEKSFSTNGMCAFDYIPSRQIWILACAYNSSSTNLTHRLLCGSSLPLINFDAAKAYVKATM